MNCSVQGQGQTKVLKKILFFFTVCSTEYEEVRDLYLRAVQSASPQDEVDADVQVGDWLNRQHEPVVWNSTQELDVHRH